MKNSREGYGNLNNQSIFTVAQIVEVLFTKKLLILIDAFKMQCELFHETYAVYDESLQICRMGGKQFSHVWCEWAYSHGMLAATFFNAWEPCM